MLGLRVRLREQPGPLSWETILRRWVSQFGANLLSLVPVLGLIAGLYPWLDGLWPSGTTAARPCTTSSGGRTS